MDTCVYTHTHRHLYIEEISWTDDEHMCVYTHTHLYTEEIPQTDD